MNKYNPTVIGRILPSLTKSYVSESEKTEKVRTPNLDEINREDGFGTSRTAERQDAQQTSSSSQTAENTAETPAMEELKKEAQVFKKRLEETDEKYKRALAEAENTR